MTSRACGHQDLLQAALFRPGEAGEEMLEEILGWRRADWSGAMFQPVSGGRVSRAQFRRVN